MRGRKPVPTELKKLRGNPGKRALPANEPKPRRVLPRAPKHLSAVAKAEWQRLARELFELGLLTVVDRTALAAYCAAYARWVRAEEEMADGNLVGTNDKGVPIKSPWVTIANEALSQMKAFMVEFGMTPSSRARIKPAEKPEEDPFEAFVRKKLDE